MIKLFALVSLIFVSFIVSAQRRPMPHEQNIMNRNNPAYLERTWVKQKKAGTAFLVAGSVLAATGTVLKIIGVNKANSPDSHAWDGFGEQVLGIGGISVGVTAIGVGVALLLRSKSNKKRLMNLQPSVSFRSFQYAPKPNTHPQIGLTLPF